MSLLALLVYPPASPWKLGAHRFLHQFPLDAAISALSTQSVCGRAHLQMFSPVHSPRPGSVRPSGDVSGASASAPGIYPVRFRTSTPPQGPCENLIKVQGRETKRVPRRARNPTKGNRKVMAIRIPSRGIGSTGPRFTGGLSACGNPTRGIGKGPRQGR